MEHIKHLSLGWLVGAAALLFAGCSSEDGVIEEQTPQQPAQTQATIHVTVGAGITDGEATTRSTVDYSGGTRTLQFSSGDRLYVWGQKDKIYDQLDNYYYEYVVAGTLELVAIDSEDPTKATFSGDLSVYRAEVQGDDGDVFTPSGVTYPDGNLVSDLSGFLQSADPLAGFENVEATLIHEDALKDVDYFITEDERKLVYRPDCAATVEELMTTQLWVSGEYDSGTKSFALAKDTDQPIVNCTISGLEAGVSYKVDYIYGTTAAMSDHSRKLFSSMEATAGTLSFAFIAQTGDKFHGIRLTNTADAGDTYTVSIGQKEFESKVYNAARTAVGKKTPLTMEALTSGTIKVNKPKSNMKYSLNGGAKITMSNPYGSTTITVEAGDKVEFYGNGTSITQYGSPYGSNCTTIAGGTADVKVYGNIMSLVNETGFATATTLPAENTFSDLFSSNNALTDASGLLLPAPTMTKSCYEGMFHNCSSLTAAPALPATTLAESCYSAMFQGCTNLKTAPALPAKTLAPNCYGSMFWECTSLTDAPAELPATELAFGCYTSMFFRCTNLKTAPALPATTLADNCYAGMFSGCTSLTDAPAELPAETLADYCYSGMFYGCSSLETAPALPAKTLADYCYQEMFSGCTNLSAVTCLATDINAYWCTDSWLSGVAASGTFTKNPSMTGWSTGISGIPDGWTRVDYVAPSN